METSIIDEKHLELFHHMIEEEVTINDMSFIQSVLKPRHRDILIKWVCETHLMLKCDHELLFIIVNIIDRMLGLKEVSKKKLHLVGIASFLIASKFYSVIAVPLNDLQICSDYNYSDEDIKRVEKIILKAIDFKLNIPTSITFLDIYYLSVDSKEERELSRYIAGVSLLSYSMIKFSSFQIAVASIYLSQEMTNDHTQNDHFECSPMLLEYINKVDTPMDVYKECIIQLNKLLHEKLKEESCELYNKYSK